eukprot:TRINITY_DN1612_c0_g1_i2.p1 TRINITY_DN1612_c0_g1~~TRINITY_DN1612_c0_g1_i2.p1  ORF type:complete len:561 (-),score=70.99 TRINITY_DN1612_c0_g1_i2:228-1910(-)
MRRIDLRMSLPVLLLISSLSSIALGDKVLFYESFSEPFQGRWTVSKAVPNQGALLQSKGENSDDLGLLVSEKARRYAVVSTFNEATDPKEGLVLQYDVRLQKGMECGGAYLKFLMEQGSDWSPENFKEDSPYSIMFGPDKCGATNKVHFIYRHKHPISGAYVEHHLKNPPFPPSDKLSHVYTAAIFPNNTVKILIDGEEKTTANLMSSDFEPPVIPPRSIPDPDDKKPSDWDERPKISDPDAVKPDDWDEDAPREILDEDAVKPEGWLDDEPLQVDDPEAVKPDDWDTDEDGEWEPPQIPNPKCFEAPGCGAWERPMKKNPTFKGKWTKPLIENPAYKGVWKPREIPNPDYFELNKPNLEPIIGVGIEIWTMTEGVLFDNVLVAGDAETAEKYRDSTWKVKYSSEKAADDKKQEEVEKKAKVTTKKTYNNAVFDALYKLTDSKLLKPYKRELTELIAKGESYPAIVYAALIGLFILFTTTIYFLLPGKKKNPKKKTVSIERMKKEDVAVSDDTEPPVSGSKEAAEGEEAVAAASESTAETEEAEKDKEGENLRRRSRRET